MLGAALVDGFLRLAFEVDENEIVLAEQQLSEMQIAVNARLASAVLTCAGCVDPAEQFVAARKPRLAGGLRALRQRHATAFEHIERGDRLAPCLSRPIRGLARVDRLGIE